MSAPVVVGLVLDPQFGDRLESLANRMHVWVVESSANRKSALRLSAAGARGTDAGVTLFKSNSPDDRERMFLGILDTVELHHYYQQPRYSVLEVVGTAASAKLQEELRSYGFRTFTVTPDGFRASKEGAA